MPSLPSPSLALAAAAAGLAKKSQHGLTSDDLIALAVVGTGVLIYVLPIIWVLISSRSSGGAKFGWFLVTVFFSWLGLAVFLIVTQVPEPPPESDQPGQRIRRFSL